MRVGWLSSYATKCGIAEYSKYLVTALRNNTNVEDVKVFGSINYGDYAVEPYPEYAVPTFGVPVWNGNKDHSFNVDAILQYNPDILHIQYEVVLYNEARLRELLDAYLGPVAITYHDNCIPHGFPVRRFALQYSHREDVGAGTGYLLPMGIENRAPVVKTFGLGRSRDDLIAPICERHGWKFEHSFGENLWRSTEELYQWLRDSDVVVLYYDEAPAAGVSIAARVALSTRRPVVVSDTTWFKDLTSEEHVYKVGNKVELEDTLEQLLDFPYIEECSWDSLASQLVEDYKSVI